MAKSINPVKDAIDKIGGPRKVAALCDVSTQAVYQWISAGRIKGLRRAIMIAEAAKIDIKELA